MSDVEEGEIEGELGVASPPPPLPEQPPQDTQQQQQQTPSAAGFPKERVLAPQAASGRAPYYAGPESNGFKGRGCGKKKRKKAAVAAGFVDVYGQGASAEVDLHRQQGPIRLADVQNLLLWVLGEGASPRWCFVKNKPLVKKVLLLVAHGLDATSWEEAVAASALPAWQRHLGQPIELQARNATLAPGSTVHALLTVPQTKKRRREDGQQQQQLQATGGAEAGGGEAAAARNGCAAAAEAVRAQNGSAAAAAAAEGLNGVSATAGTAAAKRMRLTAADDVSSRVQPQLTGGGSTAVAPEAAANEGAAAASVAAAEQQYGEQQKGEQHDVSGTARQQQLQQAAQQAAQTGGTALRRASRDGHPLPPSHYVLTLDQLQEHGYPLPRYDEGNGEMVCPKGFVATRSSKGVIPENPLVALDCEMCITGAGFELTRATLVDPGGKVLLDELVVPHNPITDYNTCYSGITAEMLKGVTTRLTDVQARFRELVAAETLVVAHSGENDLQALKIIHANVVDTALLFPHPRGPPFKSALRVLASRHLLRTIQQGEHDPVEDARAALDLALLKFERGPAYGATAVERGERLVEVLGAAGRRSTMVDRLELLNKQVTGNCSAVVAEGDGAVVAALARELPKAQVEFLWGQLVALQDCYEARLTAAKQSRQAEPTSAYRLPPPGGMGQQQNGDASLPTAAEQGQEQQQEQEQGANKEQQEQQQQGQQAAALAVLDASLAALWASAPLGTLVVVVTGQGDTAYSRYLQEQKWRRQQGLGGQPPWGPTCEAHLAAWQARVQSALCFAAVKHQQAGQQQPGLQPVVEQQPLQQGEQQEQEQSRA